MVRFTRDGTGGWLNLRLRNIGRGVAVQPYVRLRGIDNGTNWLHQPNLTAGWTVVTARGSPTPGEVLFGSNANTVVYPTVDEGVVHVMVRTPGIDRHALAGDIFCRETSGVAFDGHALLDQEVVFPA